MDNLYIFKYHLCLSFKKRKPVYQKIPYQVVLNLLKDHFKDEQLEFWHSLQHTLLLKFHIDLRAKLLHPSEVKFGKWDLKNA